MSASFAGVSPQWISELAEITALTLADFRRGVAGEPFAMLAVDCHPADGIISLSMLLAAEGAIDPTIADPSRTASWKHQGLERKTGMWRLAAGVERVMQETYHCSPDADRPAISEAFTRACGQAMRSDRVASELARFERRADFRLITPGPA